MWQLKTHCDYLGELVGRGGEGEREREGEGKGRGRGGTDRKGEVGGERGGKEQQLLQCRSSTYATVVERFGQCTICTHGVQQVQ